MFLYFVVSRSQSVFFKWLEHDGCCVCFFVFSLFFFLWLLVQRNCCACYHYSVDFLGKGRVFWFQSLLRVCLPYSIYQSTSRLSLSFHPANLWSRFIGLEIAIAYESIPHRLLFFALEYYGVDPHWMSLITIYYSEIYSHSFSQSTPFLSTLHQCFNGIFAGCTLL